MRIPLLTSLSLHLLNHYFAKETNNLGEVKLLMHIPYQLRLVNFETKEKQLSQVSHKDIKKL